MNGALVGSLSVNVLEVGNLSYIDFVSFTRCLGQAVFHPMLKSGVDL